mgnify:CR=1 FL=1
MERGRGSGGVCNPPLPMECSEKWALFALISKRVRGDPLEGDNAGVRLERCAMARLRQASSCPLAIPRDRRLGLGPGLPCLSLAGAPES